VSWTSDDGLHKGWRVAEFPDGRVGSSASGGVSILPPDDAISMTSGVQPEPVDGRTAGGWRWICTCGQLGPLHRRVPAEKDASPALRRVYWPEPRRDADPPGGVDAAIEAEWRAHLPSPALAAVTAAVTAEARAKEATAEAVRAAAATGETWESIGAAAGIRRQSAWARWHTVVTGEANREKGP
jgi:hypothetical protein